MQNSLLQSLVWKDPWHITEYTYRHYSTSQGDRTWPTEDHTDDKPHNAWTPNFFFFFSKGHKDVTWVLVRKVFLQGSSLTEDPNTALNQTESSSHDWKYWFSAAGTILHHRFVYTNWFLLTCNNPRPMDKLSASVIVDSVPLLWDLHFSLFEWVSPPK